MYVHGAHLRTSDLGTRMHGLICVHDEKIVRSRDAQCNFTITRQILAHLLANFYRQ